MICKEIVRNTTTVFFLILACGCALVSDAQTSCAPAPVGLVSWWQAENNTLDSRGRNDGTLQSGATFTAGKVGQGYNLISNSSVTAPGDGSLDLTGNQFTIEGWIKLENNPVHPTQRFAGSIGKLGFPNDQNQIVFENSGQGGSAGLPANQWQFEYILNNSSGTRVHNQRTNVIVTVDGNYHHFALTYDGAAAPSNNVKLYVDGVLRMTNINGGDEISGNLKNSPAHLFQISSGGGVPFSADEVSVYNRALFAQEIQAIFNAGTAGKCKPTATISPSGLVGWWAGDGNADDISGNGLNGAFNGTNSFSIGKVGQNFNFTGSQTVQVADTSALDFTNAFTIEMWVSPTAAGSNLGQTFFVSKGDMNNTNTQSYGILFADTRQIVNRAANGSALDQLVSNAQIPLNTFTHIATTYDGSTLKIYINGVLDSSKTTSLGTLLNSSQPLIIGGADFGGGSTINAQSAIDETALYNRALTDPEIASVFNAGLAGKLKLANTPAGFALSATSAVADGLSSFSGISAEKIQPPATAGGSDFAPQVVNVSVGDATVSFPSVTAAGATQEIPLDTSLLPALPMGTFTGLADDISTSASFTGNPTVCFNLNSFTATQFNNLRVFHFESGAWIDRTASGNPFPNLCTVGITSLSPFAIVQVAPTAANVSVGGVISDASGFPIPQARISMTDSNGITRTARTNSFGYYRFESVRVGETYVFNVFSKEHQFQAQIISVADEIADLNFTSLQ